jgi:hypothetical protein
MKSVSILLLATVLAAFAQTNAVSAKAGESTTNSVTTNQIAWAERTEQVRSACVQGRRAICGKVVRILPEGLLVESGYTALLKAPFTQSWVTSGGASVTRDAKSLELNEPGAACVGLVVLANFPKRPSVKLYDYVAIQAYPMGQQTYTSVPGVQKTVRKFSAGLDTAIKVNLEMSQK